MSEYDIVVPSIEEIETHANQIDWQQFEPYKEELLKLTSKEWGERKGLDDFFTIVGNLPQKYLTTLDPFQKTFLKIKLFELARSIAYEQHPRLKEKKY